MKHAPSPVIRFTLYPLVAIIFAVVAILIILFASGYDISYQDGRIVTEKTGLIIVSTTPGEATVYVDGKEYKDKTPNFSLFRLKINRVKPGNHDLVVAKEGYIPWEGSVNVEPGYVTWLDYLFLIPLEKEAEPFVAPGAVAESINSQDNTRSLVKYYDKKEQIASVWLLNTENKDLTKIYETEAKESSVVDLISFSHDKERFLMKVTDGKTVSYVVRESRANGSSWNLTGLFGVSFDKIAFSPYTHNQLYLVRDKNLYDVNLSTKTVSAVLAKNVYGIYATENGLLFVQKSNDNYGLYKISQSGEKENVVKSFPAAEKYGVSYLANYRSYLIYNGDDQELMIYSNDTHNPTLETIAKNVASYSVSYNGERVGYVSGNSYKIYDMPKGEYYTVLQDVKPDCVSWFRGSDNLVYLSGGELRMVNYDGQYNNPLFEATGKTTCLASPSSETVYFTSNLEKQLELFSYSF